MWKDVYEDFNDIPKSEQLALFNPMKDKLFPDDQIRLLTTSIGFNGLNLAKT